MASSTSSERAFSSAGITIGKHHNQLKPDIIEALQYLKSTIHHSLLFCESPSSFVEQKFYGAELATDAARGDSETAHGAEGNLSTWDELIEDNDGDDEALGDSFESDDEVFVPSIE